MAVTRGNSAVKAEATGSNNADVAYDAGSGGNRLMVAMSGTVDTGANNDNEYPAGSPMPHVDGVSSNPSCSLEIDANPAEDSNTLRSFGDSGIAVVGMSFNGTSGYSGKIKDQRLGDDPSVTISSDVDGLVCFALVVEDSGASLSDTDGATIETTMISSAANVRVVLATKSGTGGNVSWSPTLSASKQFFLVGFSVDPASGSSPAGINRGRINAGRVNSGLINCIEGKTNRIWQRPTRLLVPVGIQLQGV